MAYKITQGATTPMSFLMVSASDHTTGLTGLTLSAITVTLGKSGAAFAAGTGAVTLEKGYGWYEYTPSVADTGTLGGLELHATATGADPSDSQFSVEASPVNELLTVPMPGIVESGGATITLGQLLVALGLDAFPQETGAFNTGTAELTVTYKDNTGTARIVKAAQYAAGTTLNVPTGVASTLTAIPQPTAP